MKNNVGKTSAKLVATVLEKVLHVEANTTSCTFVYQPKAPKDLKQFRREK